MKILKVGISPCPHDTYIFEAIYNKDISLEEFEFEFIFEDVQTLNLMALRGELDLIKISYANFFNVIDNYALLKSGGALGKGVGPLLIAKHETNINEIASKSIAIPGINTTANFLLHFAFPQLGDCQEYKFSEIEDLVINQKVDLGLIIHENRFTYQEKGLIKIIDLGEYWESKTQLPIPLGGIAIKRSIDHEMQIRINNLVKQSIEIANTKQDLLSPFVKNHAQEMNEQVMKQHIALYVNQDSINISEEGLKAVEKMAHFISPTIKKENIFI